MVVISLSTTVSKLICKTLLPLIGYQVGSLLIIKLLIIKFDKLWSPGLLSPMVKSLKVSLRLRLPLKCSV
jgi:hypothetical protein